MPLYDFQCKSCGATHEIFAKLGKRKSKILCDCGRFAKPVITVTSKPVVMEGYIEAIEAYVTGPKQHARILKEKGISEH